MNNTHREIEVNGRRYAWPSQPLVVVCIDGSEPDYDDDPYRSDGGGYIERAIAAGCMPYLAHSARDGV